MDWVDTSVLEAASWRLGSELARRHPATLRLSLVHLGRGQADCLWLRPPTTGPGDVRLNRMGTIRVLERFDGRPVSDWDSVSWDEYLRADPRSFLPRLEAAAGLLAPHSVPAATTSTLTLRVLAALASTAVKSVRPIAIESGFLDTSGYGGGPNPALEEFGLGRFSASANDPYGEAAAAFWVVVRAGEPILALDERSGRILTSQGAASPTLMDLYATSKRDIVVTALELLRILG